MQPLKRSVRVFRCVVRDREGRPRRDQALPWTRLVEMPWEPDTPDTRGRRWLTDRGWYAANVKRLGGGQYVGEFFRAQTDDLPAERRRDGTVGPLPIAADSGLDFSSTFLWTDFSALPLRAENTNDDRFGVLLMTVARSASWQQFQEYLDSRFDGEFRVELVQQVDREVMHRLAEAGRFKDLRVDLRNDPRSRWPEYLRQILGAKPMGVHTVEIHLKPRRGEVIPYPGTEELIRHLLGEDDVDELKAVLPDGTKVDLKDPRRQLAVEVERDKHNQRAPDRQSLERALIELFRTERDRLAHDFGRRWD